jgi:predicted nucleotidyltransferase
MCSKAALDAITERVCAASKEALGGKLEKVLLFGSYARGDYDDESDVDIFVLADIPPEAARGICSQIGRLVGWLELEYDVVISIHVTCSRNFYEYRNVMPYYMNVINEGIELSYA